MNSEKRDLQYMPIIGSSVSKVHLLPSSHSQWLPCQSMFHSTQRPLRQALHPELFIQAVITASSIVRRMLAIFWVVG